MLMGWPNMNLPTGQHLNSRRVLVPPVPREGPEWLLEIQRQRALLRPELHRDLAFALNSRAWDMFPAWE
jgi:hypothetical protein